MTPPAKRRYLSPRHETTAAASPAARISRALRVLLLDPERAGPGDHDPGRLRPPSRGRRAGRELRERRLDDPVHPEHARTSCSTRASGIWRSSSRRRRRWRSTARSTCRASGRSSILGLTEREIGQLITEQLGALYKQPAAHRRPHHLGHEVLLHLRGDRPRAAAARRRHQHRRRLRPGRAQPLRQHGAHPSDPGRSAQSADRVDQLPGHRDPRYLRLQPADPARTTSSTCRRPSSACSHASSRSSCCR